MRFPSLLVAFLAPLTVISKPLFKRWDDLEVKHAWVERPRGWTLHSAAPANHKFNLRIALKQDKFDDLLTHLYEVSDPLHERRYGAHLSKEEVDALVRPHPSSVETVDDWLKYHGIETASIQRSDAGDWLTLPVTVEQAERLLGTTYNVYHNNATSEYVVRTDGYSLPRVLHPHISVVTPTTYFGGLRRMKSMSFLQPQIEPIENSVAQNQAKGSLATVPASCSSKITPACLRALYNTSGYTPQAADTNKLGVAGYLGEFANRADLQTFFSTFRTDAVGGAYTTVLVNGGQDNQTKPGVEANLDIQYTEGISFPTPNIYYSTGGSPPFLTDSNTPTNTNEPYLDWLNFVLSQSTIPQTFTTSYGDDEQTVPFDYAITVCNLFAQVGARGSSILFASGDDGVGGGNCLTNDGKNTKHFQPNFPASCPFVTTVGGTTKVNPEVAVSFSGGGFSNYFARPGYQSGAVQAFLKTLGSTFAGQFNTSGRAYPDVAAQGSGFQVVVGGRTTSVGGTSASTPTFAGVVALLNDFRISSGKAPLGFLNPLLYSSAIAGLNDITSGSNPGCGTVGFTAGVGWDPVTGLGTPDFGKLQAIVKTIS
ncbi:subtilisin-like protein [Rickenella mellea]|uniref:tripeptidyl-peptidase II n=1 Tax=Rickenella mellea TaxID=50990 RepID=A0A4Y7QAX4_9AGAM|nr:subtilisin-like protein [Rickenella mellea]